jgi:curli biogenesis system outer membrane secretion channel CsgG
MPTSTRVRWGRRALIIPLREDKRMSRPGGTFRYSILVLVLSLAAAGRPARADDKQPEIPVCDKKIGTLAVDEPEQKWWTQYNLESPEALIKVFVAQSKCFTLLDRGKGLAAAQKERALAAGGETRVGSNVGKGQMKAADYVLVPDIANQNANAGGKKIGGALGGLFGRKAGIVLGGLNLKSKTADVVLTLTDVRSTEQVAVVQGHAKKTDLGWGAGGAMFTGGGFAAAGASSYANTEIGQVVAMAYLDAYVKLVDEVQKNTPNAGEDNVSQSVTMAKPGRMYASAGGKGAVVRTLDAGMMLYPSGEKEGIWWKVSDELGNEGWVSSTLFNLAK